MCSFFFWTSKEAQDLEKDRGATRWRATGQRKILAWLPLQSLAVNKNSFFVEILGGEKLLKLVESAGEIFLAAWEGLMFFSVAFRIFFRVFQTVFRIDLKVFRGQFRSADMPP